MVFAWLFITAGHKVQIVTRSTSNPTLPLPSPLHPFLFQEGLGLYSDVAACFLLALADVCQVKLIARLESGKARSTLSPSRVCVLMTRRLLCCTAYKQSYFVSASDTLISLWRPATETSLVVHVSTSCGTWWPHVSFTLSYTHTYLDTLTWGNGVPQLRSQMDRPQDRRTIWKGWEKK